MEEGKIKHFISVWFSFAVLSAMHTHRSLFQQIKQTLVRARESERKSSRLTCAGANLSVDEGERLAAVPRSTTRLCNHLPLIS